MEVNRGKFRDVERLPRKLVGENQGLPQKNIISICKYLLYPNYFPTSKVPIPLITFVSPQEYNTTRRIKILMANFTDGECEMCGGGLPGCIDICICFYIVLCI